MTPTETVVLTEYVQACCPHQAIGEYTPDAWYDLLGDLELADCKTAAAVIAKRQPFVAASEIRAEVKRIRRDRIERDPAASAVPHDLAGEPGKYKHALQARIREIADGFSAERAAGPMLRALPPPAARVRKAIGPARPAPVPDRHLPPEEIARRQAAESRIQRGAPVSAEPEAGEPAA